MTCATVLGSSGSLAIAQEKPYPIFNEEKFVAAMKTVGQALAAVNASLGRNEYDESKAYLAISRDRLATTVTFWRDRHDAAALRLLKDSLTKMDDLDSAMSADTVDAAAVSAAAKQVGATCQACHAVYREQDPTTKAYRFKSTSGR